MATKDMARVIKALCPNCQPCHVLDNGRVWFFCGANRLIGDWFTEDEVRKAILGLDDESVLAGEPVDQDQVPTDDMPSVPVE